MGKLVTRNELSVILGCNPQTVSNYIRGGMPIAHHGIRGGGSSANPDKIDTEHAIKWLISKAVGDVVTDARDKGQTTLAGENIRLTTAKAEKTELEVAEKRGQLLHDDIVDQALQATFTTISTQVRAFGSRLAGELAGMTDPAAIRELLNEESRRVLTSAAEQVAHLAEDQIEILAAEAAAESDDE